MKFDGSLPPQSTRITIHFGDTINANDFFDLPVVADLR